LLPEDDLRRMRELVSVGEPGVALENLCTQIFEYDVSLSAELANEVEAVAAAMDMCVAPPLKIRG
jgi:hypothetical protein